MSDQDQAIEAMHQDIGALCDVLAAIINLCRMEANGVWIAPTIAGGSVWLSTEMSKALDRGLKALVKLRYSDKVDGNETDNIL